MKKLFAILMSVLMIACFMPTMAFAGETEKGTEQNPYTLADLGNMDRQAYIDAQKTLGGTMYVEVGDYQYSTNGTLGNGERNDTPGQTPDHSKLNAYAENGYLSLEGADGKKNDGANGKNIVFVGGTITSGATGYTDIDHIGTSLLLAVPAYTNVTFKGTQFNGVFSFNYQLYTSPWSQLGELKFDGCTFNGIIVGATAAQTLTFDGCTFNNYTNSTSANNSNPTWIRPAYGNWTPDDNIGQGEDFKSLTKINFTNNKVTSTRPVKFEYVAQWKNAEVTITGNTFNISGQTGDAECKNVGIYLGAHESAYSNGNEKTITLTWDNNKTEGETAAAICLPTGKQSLPKGSKVLNSSREEIAISGREWKTENNITIGNTVSGYATLQEAINAAKDGSTVELLADTTEDITIPAGKKVTLNLNGKTLTNKNSDTITVAKDAELTIEGTGTVDNVTHAKAAIVNYGTAVLKGGTYTRSKEDADNNKGSAGKNSFYTILNDKGGNMTIQNGVEVTNVGHFSSMIRNGGDGQSQAVSKLQINGGTFSGGINTVKNDEYGELTITGGSFSNTSQFVIMNWHKAILSGGTYETNEGAEAVLFTARYRENRAIGELTVTGGTYKCADNQKLLCDRWDNNEQYKGTANITGGEFSSNPKDYVDKSCKVFKVSDTKFMVATDDAKPAGYYWTAVEGKAWDYEGTAITYTPYVPTDNVTNQSENTATGTPATTTADINASTTTAADGTKTTTATVDDQTADKIVDKATANKSEQIIIDATSAAGAAAAAEVGIPEKTVKEIAEKTDANLTFKTDAAKVQLDKNAVDALAAQAGTTGTVKLLVKTVKSDADIHQVELKLVTSNGAVTDFHGGNVTVTIKPSATLNAKEVICVYIDDNGVYHRVDGKKNADGTYTFTTGHFSTYAIMSVEDAEKVFEQQDAKAAEQAKEIMLQARSAKTAKGNIKVNLKVNEDAIKAIEDLGYTVKYKFYRSTIKNAKYVGKFETTAKTYTNTTGKKGTRYYYKARVMVYDAQGELVAKTALTQCKYACRIK